MAGTEHKGWENSFIGLFKGAKWAITPIDGEIIEEPEEIVEVREVDSNISGFLNLSFIFLVTNIPTVVLSGVYVSERNKITMRKQIEKMKIDDL